MRDSSIFYRSFYEAIKSLPESNQLEVYNAIFEYSFNFNEIELTGLSKTIFTLIKPQLEANKKRFENGTKPKVKPEKSKTEAKQKQKISKAEANNNVNNNDNDNEKVNKNKVNEIENNNFDFKSALISYGFNTELVSDWMQVRKAKKATNTETSFNNFVSQVEKSGVDKNEILKICISRDWKGFNTDWIKDMDIPKEKKPFISNNPYFALCDSQPTLSDKLKKQQYEF
jgi:hypothetical protein